ncbi:VOC family protein [Millisia brevis]|uniref:VOC family protein n=1 Tax=Millisia brevis TaxID=264148 RepID=UPI00082C8ACE|nr:VOC family protein [Millisia brevis]
MTSTSAVPTRTDHNLWPGVSYDDALAARRWLAALGFEEGIAVPGPAEGELIHSEMLWPEGGRVMVHSRTRSTESEFVSPPGAANIYVVCDDPDAVFARAEALEAPVIRPMEETDYGSRGFSIRDVEGNAWSFGTYAGA